MKIIQTFWTVGQDPLKHRFGWAHPEYNLMSWALSCLSLREHYGLTFDVDKKSYVEFIRKFVKE